MAAVSEPDIAATLSAMQEHYWDPNSAGMFLSVLVAIVIAGGPRWLSLSWWLGWTRFRLSKVQRTCAHAGCEETFFPRQFEVTKSWLLSRTASGAQAAPASIRTFFGRFRLRSKADDVKIILAEQEYCER